MYVRFSEYGNRFITHNNFLELCKQLEIKLLSSNIDENWLEYLEKSKILIPEFRLVRPIWYLTYFIKYKEEQRSKIRSSKWKKAKSDFDKIERWSISNRLFHPFDHKSLSSQYVIDQRKQKF